MSQTIQNELPDLTANQILKSIVTDYNNADCFTFNADESTDVSIKGQIPICVRFVHKTSADDNGMKQSVREEFLSFVYANTGSKADDLESIDSADIIQKQIRGQGYDGAFVVSGQIGVQTRIRAIIPRSQLLHCRRHVFNHCIVLSSKLRIVRSVMDTMTEVSVAFKTSAERRLEFQEQQEHNAPVREEIGKTG